ncbi:terpene synthase [Micromonospora sp. ALFpr18c]|uniref:terpene synthase family protein n=1 Tax=Micromonospora sp. ALFpr18c TaxID=1458665 RepID=UPI00124AF619|nr:terpene synthase [Micromonospora sp. ALFpr18c]KAB1942436.1 terpene synthase [Micromonospora sp. ALFpr18c]
MAPLPRVGDELQQAAEHGRVCALAAYGQRDLQRCLTAHPDLFAEGPFDGALTSSIALAIAFSAPWCEAVELRLTNRAVLWGFALDWQVDRLATSAVELDRLVQRQLSVTDGASAATDDPLGRFLAGLHADLVAVPAFATLGGAWRAAARRTLHAMRQEWQWKTAMRDGLQPPPTLADYLNNADNLACTVVNVVHWIRTGGADTQARLDRLVIASDAVQRALRLVNDLSTHERDLRWGDLNAIMLVDDRAVVEQVLKRLVTDVTDLLDELRADCPREAAYLTRQLGYTTGFYRSTDFWGVS